MSRVCNIIMICHPADAALATCIFTDIVYEPGQSVCPDPVLAGRESNGPKHLEMSILYTAWNYAASSELDQLTKNFHEAKWHFPETAVLTITHEEGSTEIYRPGMCNQTYT